MQESEGSNNELVLSADQERLLVALTAQDIVLQPEHIRFLSEISKESADDFYNSLTHPRALLNKNAANEERFDLSKGFITSFTKAFNKALKRTIKFKPKLEDDEQIFSCPHFETFSKPKVKMPASNTSEDEEEQEKYQISLGRFDHGLFLVIDRFGDHYNQCVKLNEHEDALNETRPVTQVCTIAHEAGHCVADFIETRSSGGMRIPLWMDDAEQQFSMVIDSDVNHEAYKASPSEQYAELFANVALSHILRRLDEDFGDELSKAERRAVTEMIEDSQSVIEATEKRSRPSARTVQVQIPR
ncbi:MAG: hypothetical protein AAF549_08060 [Pseudomonadota bacterium]